MATLDISLHIRTHEVATLGATLLGRSPVPQLLEVATLDISLHLRTHQVATLGATPLGSSPAPQLVEVATADISLHLRTREVATLGTSPPCGGGSAWRAIPPYRFDSGQRTGVNGQRSAALGATPPYGELGNSPAPQLLESGNSGHLTTSQNTRSGNSRRPCCMKQAHNDQSP